MSGGVGPSADVGIGKADVDDGPKPSPAGPSSPPRRYLSFGQLNVLAVMIVLSASGMVAPSDLALTVFSLIYLLFLSRAAFPHLHPTATAPPPVFGPTCRPLAVYVSVGGIIGLLLPVAYILHGLIQGDQEGVQAAAPHLFLLSSQVFFEGITFAGGFSLPVRAFVPVFYNSVRLFAISDWLRAEFGKEDGQHGSPERLLAGRTLAVANMAFWAFNLFGFLLPLYLPRAFRNYYGYKEKA